MQHAEKRNRLTAILTLAACTGLVLSGCSTGGKEGGQAMPMHSNGVIETKSGYAPVNGLKMYYEIKGSGKPLVFLPIQLGRAGLLDFPNLSKEYSVITPDVQGHGRTADIPDRPITVEQHAKDVAGLLEYLGIKKADFFGESVGGIIATMVAVRYPDLVGRVVTYGSFFGKPQDSIKPEMLENLPSLTADDPAFQFQRENYKKVAPDPSYWPKIWTKVFLFQWSGFTREELTSLKAPFLIAAGDHDFVRVDHVLEASRVIPNAELAIIPDAGHFALYSAPEKLLPTIESFLKRSSTRTPFATTATGYHPGETR